MFLHANDGAEWPSLDQRHFVGFVQIPMLFFEIGIDIPCVPFCWFVIEGLQKVAAGKLRRATCIGFGWSEGFRVISQIVKTGDTSGLRVDLQLNKRILKYVSRSLDNLLIAFGIGGWLCHRAYEISPVSHPRSICEDEKTRSVRALLHSEQLGRNPLVRFVDHFKLTRVRGKLCLYLNHFGTRP